MELIKELKEKIYLIKDTDTFLDTDMGEHIIDVLRIISSLCESAGENQWSIKDQIDLAINELEI